METTAAAYGAGTPRQKLEFRYDPFGRRVGKKVYQYAGGWVLASEGRFAYDEWNLIAEFSVSGSTLTGLRTFAWGLDLSGSRQGAGGVGGLLKLTEAGNSYLPSYDGNGNVVAMIKAADGSLAAAYEYDAFGRTLRESGTYTGNPVRYSSKYTDPETGEIYYGYRVYSPSLGRFLNRDPKAESGGINLYAFVGNNGVGRYDYLGLHVEMRRQCSSVYAVEKGVKTLLGTECSDEYINVPDDNGSGNNPVTPTPTGSNPGGGTNTGGTGTNSNSPPQTPANPPGKDPSDCVAKADAQLRKDLSVADINYRFGRDAILADAMFVGEMQGYGDRIESAWKFAGTSVISLGAGAIAQAGATALGASRVANAATVLQNTITAANAGRYGTLGAEAINLAANGLTIAQRGQGSLNLIASVGGGALNATTQAIFLGGDPWTPSSGLMDLGDAFLGGPVLDTTNNAMAIATAPRIPRSADLALSDRGGMLSALKGNSDLFEARTDAAYSNHFNAILSCYK